MAPPIRQRRVQEVLADLADGHADPVYVLVGDDEAGKQPVIDALCGLVEPDLQLLNVERFHATDPRSGPSGGVDAIERAVAAARTFPMLGSRRVVLILRAEAFLKRAGAGASDDGEAERADEEGPGDDLASSLASLDEYVRTPAPHASLVIVASDVNRSTRIGKALLQAATVVEFWGLRGSRDSRGVGAASVMDAAERYVRSAATAAGKSVAPSAIEPLVEYAGTDIGLLRGAVERVLLFCSDRPTVTEADVRAVVSGESSFDQWAVTNAIAAGDAREALRQLKLTLEAGVSPYLVLGQLGWYVRTKLPKFASERVAEAVGHQFAFDLAMKTSGGDPQVLLERLVVSLCGRSGPGRRLRGG